MTSDPTITEQHRIERIVSGLRNGESTVINGVPCTAVSLQTANLLTRHASVAARCRRLSAASPIDCEQLADTQDELAMCRRQLADAGQLHLIEVE